MPIRMNLIRQRMGHQNSEAAPRHLTPFEVKAGAAVLAVALVALLVSFHTTRSRLAPRKPLLNEQAVNADADLGR